MANSPLKCLTFQFMGFINKTYRVRGGHHITSKYYSKYILRNIKKILYIYLQAPYIYCLFGFALLYHKKCNLYDLSVKYYPRMSWLYKKNSGFSLRDNFIFEIRKWYGYKVVWCQKRNVNVSTHEKKNTWNSSYTRKWFQQKVVPAKHRMNRSI